jgi:hypothetical protein
MISLTPSGGSRLLFPAVPYLSREELRRSAELFLDQYHPSKEVPVPIEEILESDLNIEIRPLPGWRGRFGIDGSLTVDLQTIVVDSELLTRLPRRYRFTLAHELGHRILHPEQVKALAGSSREEWKAAVRGIPSREYSWMEFQASEFAGNLLVPRGPLLYWYQQAAQRAERGGIDLAELRDWSMSTVAGWIADEFEVSTEVVEIRLRNEGLLT